MGRSSASTIIVLLCFNKIYMILFNFKKFIWHIFLEKGNAYFQTRRDFWVALLVPSCICMECTCFSIPDTRFELWRLGIMEFVMQSNKCAVRMLYIPCLCIRNLALLKLWECLFPSLHSIACLLKQVPAGRSGWFRCNSSTYCSSHVCW